MYSIIKNTYGKKSVTVFMSIDLLLMSLGHIILEVNSNKN